MRLIEQLLHVVACRADLLNVALDGLEAIPHAAKQFKAVATARRQRRTLNVAAKLPAALGRVNRQQTRQGFERGKKLRASLAGQRRLQCRTSP